MIKERRCLPEKAMDALFLYLIMLYLGCHIVCDFSYEPRRAFSPIQVSRSEFEI